MAGAGKILQLLLQAGRRKVPPTPLRKGLVPALRDKKGGNVLEGEPGQLHSDIYQTHGMQADPRVFEEGFAVGGKFLNREEAKAFANRRRLLLKELNPEVKRLPDLDAVDLKAVRKRGK